MKASLTLSLLAAPLAAQAHYIFSQLIVNGQAKGGDYTYIRKNSNSYMPSFTNDIVNSPDLRCNSGARPGTAQTYTVKAGDKVGFKLWYNEFIEHPGPGFVYMSKAPGSVNTYDGSGDWFKAYETGLCGGQPNQDTAWCTWQKDRIEFTIPARIPPGEYLVRVEHLAIHESHVGKGQFYMECAQLKIEGPGGGKPGPLVKIPGIYKASDPGIAYNKWTNRPAKYVMPGPAVWVDNGSTTADNGSGSNSTGGGDSNKGGGESGAAGASLYGQCGGKGWNEPTTCAQGTCKVVNEWYSQCV
ncbi:cellulose-growth-specific protein [Magnaporthiopsis poae ATCC 64411]|uniref:lytic cellulose monooxygenase (C4-dehydrogenating) n=1 Tax=Magnaporthiopsis poae (strain ATCC 64411 / 73-15) TaxID=644358 RepID=A0A0C4EEI9_MAGP6|nr:cellulose-growth-specific protein [Magnaporthiopsis poae ATCC 64411]